MLSRTQARRKRVGGLVVTHGHHQVRIVCGMVVRDNYRVFPYEYSPQLSFFTRPVPERETPKCVAK